jgi:serine O-acetyltransferase
MKSYQETLADIGHQLADRAAAEYRAKHNAAVNVPNRKEVISIIKDLQSLMFPTYYQREENRIKSRDEILYAVFHALKRQIGASFSLEDKNNLVDTEAVALQLLEKLPQIQSTLYKDIEALYEGDPAAKSREEVVLSYPGFYAISIFRIAHELYLLKVPYLPRMMTEFAHEKTGIDIHAGATIGDYFFIDHGTGIVIGETTVIGDHVKLYQGVTLGAKSFELDENGNPVKGIKRHPNIGNGVIIYANATILGGRTTIGDHAVIGGNVWITHSVEAGKTVVYTEK